MFWLQCFGVLNFCYWSVPLIITDIKKLILPDHWVLCLLGSGLYFNHMSLYLTQADALLSAMLGYLILTGIYYIFLWIRKAEGLGQGDIKLCAALLAWIGILNLGWLLTLASLFTLGLKFLLGHSFKFLKKYAGPFAQRQIPLGPGLIFAGLVLLIKIILKAPAI